MVIKIWYQNDRQCLKLAIKSFEQSVALAQIYLFVFNILMQIIYYSKKKKKKLGRKKKKEFIRNNHSLSSVSRVVIRCHSLYHSMSFVAPLAFTRCHSLSLRVMYHSSVLLTTVLFYYCFWADSCPLRKQIFSI